METRKPLLLVIFDGWGMRDEKEGNAIAKANIPFFNSLLENYPYAKLEASGLAMGLPEGQIGSSEIGHGIIGAGSVIDTDMVKLNKLSEEDKIAESPAIQEAFEHAKKNNSVLHLCGQVSPGGVHSHQDHLYALLRAAKKAGIEKVAIHAFLDGRDTAPTSGEKFISQLEAEIEKIGVGFIATVSGRYFAMDRDNNWDRVEKVEKLLFEGIGRDNEDLTPTNMLKKLYLEGETDEFVKPVIFKDKEGNTYPLSQNDSVIFFNFRPDRARELGSKISEKAKNEGICFVTLTEHDPKMECLVAYPPQKIETCLADQLSKAGLTQIHIAETEKYAHVTYFLNGGNEKRFPNEDRILIDSRKDVPTHDLAPEMKVKEIADAVVAAIKGDPNFEFKESAGEPIKKGVEKHDVIIINIANADMVGHTGNMDAAIKAVEAVDPQLKRMVEAVIEEGGVAFITADHGNAEQMVDPKTGERFTAHTTYPVPGILTDKNIKLKKTGGLADVTPTILELLNIEQPKEMTGKSLIES